VSRPNRWLEIRQTLNQRDADYTSTWNCWSLLHSAGRGVKRAMRRIIEGRGWCSGLYTATHNLHMLDPARLVHTDLPSVTAFE